MSKKLKVILVFAVLYGVMIFRLVDNFRPNTVKEEPAEVAPEGAAAQAQAPVSEAMAPTDAELVASVYETPADLDAEEGAVPAVMPVADVLGRSRELPPAEPKRKGISMVSLEDPVFWSDFESIRTDEVRNPDSELNRQKVISIMKMRQRRLGQVAN